MARTKCEKHIGQAARVRTFQIMKMRLPVVLRKCNMRFSIQSTSNQTLH
jgi:hypothetical protein